MPKTHLLLTIAVIAAPTFAAEPQVYRLSPAERDAAIASAARQPESSALLPDPARDRVLNNSLYGDDAVPDGKPHGEVSMFIGTGGARGIAATIGAPLGETGFAQFSFQTSRLPGQQYRPYHWTQRR